MIKVILLTLLVYWTVHLISFIVLTNVFNRNVEEVLILLSGPVFHITGLICWLCHHKIYPWVSDNFCYSIVRNRLDGKIYYCKRKYFYALVNNSTFTPQYFKRKEFCAKEWHKDNVSYSSKYAPRYIAKAYLRVDEEICKQALEENNKDMENFKKNIKRGASHV